MLSSPRMHITQHWLMIDPRREQPNMKTVLGAATVLFIDRSFAQQLSGILLVPRRLLDADTTCHGITSNGNPCRRSLAATPSGTPSGSPASKRSRQQKQQQGRLDRQELYCWQHKDQAAHHSPSPSPMSKKSGRSGGAGSELVYRSSIDTLVERLGILKVDSELREKGKMVQGQSGGGPRKGGKKTSGGRSSSNSGGLGKLLLCCFCFDVPTGKRGDAGAACPTATEAGAETESKAGAGPVPLTPTKVRPADAAAGRATSAPARLFGPEAGRPRPSSGANRRQKPGGPNSLSLIPASLAPEAATSLKIELERPFVESEEPGYIYMFWMTPTNTKTPPSRRRGRGRRRRKKKSKKKNKKKKKTMLLKIGRTSNVQRRMNEWSRQCGYDVEVLRFYPYVSGAERGMAGTIGTSMMTPHVKKVERLIHLELLGMGLRAELGTCDACGREHREWFEVEVSRESVRAVDDVIRRWVGWDEGNI
ncbi:unnamed protein product [Parascedosporium putredinis]|uniref:Bacteriophage T5 Orf172 DNA-binding domain-containing protein n=1 Tax=Parascedosporium putredinis TaxID=1442378 RepID=A0A9P1GYV1_9PEZI|nr:unnamed protein product [Parascedosporium putredinis]CAI7991141.1 unnamed protein product [Parascedosporium putredinis]